MEDTDVEELTTEEGWREAFPVLVELREDLTEATYLEYLREMREEGYRLFAASGDDRERGDGNANRAVLAVAGVAVRTNFYNGRHLFVYDLVTRPDRRSEGHGGRLMDFLEGWARERGCESIALESGLWREDAHRFYEDRLDMNRFCYTFRKELDG
jgi:GNAT superfamily N-acetyltransferase